MLTFQKKTDIFALRIWPINFSASGYRRYCLDAHISDGEQGAASLNLELKIT